MYTYFVFDDRIALRFVFGAQRAPLDNSSLDPLSFVWEFLVWSLSVFSDKLS